MNESIDPTGIETERELEVEEKKPGAPALRPIRAGVFRRMKLADHAVGELVRAGFSKDHITVVCSSSAQEHFDEFEAKEAAGSHTGAATLGGGAIGAVLGGLVALSGLGLLVAGPLLAGVGALTGGFVGAMMSRGVESEATNYYDQAVRKGDILVAVECDPGTDQFEKIALAERVLVRSGAQPLPLKKG